MNAKSLNDSSKNIKPYTPAPPVSEIAKSLDGRKVLKLNSNENLFLSKELLQEIMIEAAYETDPRLYPQDEEMKLKKALASNNGVETDQVMVTAGGDQLIELLFSLLKQGDKVTAVTPTFSMYTRAAKQRGVTLVEAQIMQDFSLDVEKTLKKAAGSELLIICNPNNPTGNQFPKEKVEQLIAGFEGLVLLDEAYQEYSDYSLADFVEKYDSLIILRTFSKAYGLAGLRLGYCISTKKLITVLRERYMMPYPVSNLVMRIGLKTLEKQEAVKEAVELAKAERVWLLDELNKIPDVQAYPSDACFVLFKTEKPILQVYDALLGLGVVVSKQLDVLGQDYLRVTVSPRPMGQRFIKALKEAIK